MFANQTPIVRYTHLSLSIYIYVYIYIAICVSTCVLQGALHIAMCRYILGYIFRKHRYELSACEQVVLVRGREGPGWVPERAIFGSCSDELGTLEASQYIVSPISCPKEQLLKGCVHSSRNAGRSYQGSYAKTLLTITAERLLFRNNCMHFCITPVFVSVVGALGALEAPIGGHL